MFAIRRSPVSVRPRSPRSPSLAALATLGLLGLLAAACGGDGKGAAVTSTAAGPTSVVPDLGAVSLTVGVETASAGDQPVRIASGAFNGTPYGLKWAEFDSTNTALEALNAGAVDVLLNISPQAVVLGQGNAKTAWTPSTAPFSIAAVTLPADPTHGTRIIVHNDSGIATVADLKGKKVAFVAGSSTQLFLVISARAAGLATADIEQVKLSAADGRAAFAARKVDALVTSYRQSARMLAAGDSRVLAEAGASFPRYRAALVRRGLLDDPARAAAVADLIGRSDTVRTWINANLDAASAIYAAKDDLKAPEAKLSATEADRRLVPIDATVLTEFQREADIFLSEGTITTKVDVGVVFDDRFNSLAKGS